MNGFSQTAFVSDAIGIAVKAHAGAVDKAGSPYILHPLRVMLAQQDDNARIAGVLHDVVEDTDVSFDDLAAAGIPPAVLDALRLLTHDGTPYEQYIERLKSNPIARAVKLADLQDNMDVRRLPEVTERDAKRLTKYIKAWRLLMS
ncbi:MAG: HD domain-containing protein [Planctomycetes bacterium]|nr:HD domain-containing protein [Planctomycetota bacterium]